VLNVYAQSAAIAAVKPAPTLSFPEPVDAALIMETLAKTMGFSFENNGVSAMLNKGAYFHGSALDQVKDCAVAADINYTVDRGTLSIWPRNGYRKRTPVKISRETGMVGYPSFSSMGLTLTTLFNPDLEAGGRVEVVSDLPVACGIWIVFRVSHSIESETPDGAWFTQVECYPNV
jgi:hypothetical protein